MRLALFLASIGMAGALPAPARALAAGTVAVVWERGPVQGRVEVSAGEVRTLSMTPGAVEGANGFSSRSGEPCRLELVVDGGPPEGSGRRTVVNLGTAGGPFSFFLDDVDARRPILVAAYGSR